MHDNTAHLTHARSLKVDILAAPAVWLPRRDIVLEWLNGFLARAEATTYELGDTEAADLKALEHFIRKNKIPVVA